MSSYDVGFNKETTENSALYFSSSEDLLLLLESLVQGKINRSFYATKMKEIAQRRYKWEVIINEYEKVFQE